MSNDNVVDFPGLSYAEIEPRKMLEAIAEDQADAFERCIVIAVIEGETLIFTSSGCEDSVIADMARAQHGFIASTFEDE
jgi:hypothetical protein